MMSASDQPLSSPGAGHSAPASASSGKGMLTSSPYGATIRPQPVTEKSLMESVAGFINDVQVWKKEEMLGEN